MHDSIILGSSYIAQFFLIFVLWAVLFCAWAFATLVGLNAHASLVRPNFNIDGQMIAIIVLFVSPVFFSMWWD